MKKRLAYILLAFSIPVFLLASSNIALNQVKPLLEVLQNRYGDTYRLCNLRAYKERVYMPKAYPRENIRSKSHLTLIGDSYSFKISPTAYQTETFTHSTWRRAIPPINDTAELNILVMETTERFTRERLGDIRHFEQNKKLSEFEEEDKWAKIYSINNEDNLQSISFMDPISILLRELKAYINQRFFGRIDENVEISSNKKHLYIQETIDSTLQTSAFQYLSDKEMALMVENANKLRTLALSMGYDEVYLSIIPNKVTVMDKLYKGMNYNQLIPRLEQHPSLQMPTIKVLDWIKDQHYYVGDTHWNYEGADVWIKQVNGFIQQKP